MTEAQDTEPLWEAYDADRSTANRNALVERYLGLARLAARAMAKRIPNTAAEELLGAAAEGLMRAIERFDRGRGVPLKTFAYRRIRGAIADWCRGQDHLNRLERAKNGRPISSSAKLQQFSQLSEGSNFNVPAAISTGGIEAADLVRRVFRSVAGREQVILWRYFAEGQTLRQIGAALGLSEAWASLALRAALARVRRDLGGWYQATVGS